MAEASRFPSFTTTDVSCRGGDFPMICVEDADFSACRRWLWLPIFMGNRRSGRRPPENCARARNNLVRSCPDGAPLTWPRFIKSRERFAAPTSPYFTLYRHVVQSIGLPHLLTSRRSASILPLIRSDAASCQGRAMRLIHRSGNPRLSVRSTTLRALRRRRRLITRRHRVRFASSSRRAAP